MDFLAHLAKADRAVQGVLGGAVTYTPGTGAAVEVRGVFDAAYVRVDAGQPGVSSCGPAVFLRLADLPSDPRTDEDATVTAEGVVYCAREVQPDGLGGVILHLHRA